MTLVTSGRPGRRRELGGLVRQTDESVWDWQGQAENDTSNGPLKTGDQTGEEIRQIRSKIIPKESQELKEYKKPYRCDDPSCQKRGKGFKTTQVLSRQERDVARRIYGTRVRRVVVW